MDAGRQLRSVQHLPSPKTGYLWQAPGKVRGALLRDEQRDPLGADGLALWLALRGPRVDLLVLVSGFPPCWVHLTLTLAQGFHHCQAPSGM